MKKLKTLPEKMYHGDRLSKEFLGLIKKMPVYSGILQENGVIVEMNYLQSKGYDPRIALNYFLKGLLYAYSISKSTHIYVPDGLKEGIEEKIDKVFDEAKYLNKSITEYSDFQKLKQELMGLEGK